MFVRLAQEVHLAVGDAEAGRQHAFHGHVAIVKSTPEKNMKYYLKKINFRIKITNYPWTYGKESRVGYDLGGILSISMQ